VRAADRHAWPMTWRRFFRPARRFTWRTQGGPCRCWWKCDTTVDDDALWPRKRCPKVSLREAIRRGRSGGAQSAHRKEKTRHRSGNDVMEWPNPGWTRQRHSAWIWAGNAQAPRRAGFRQHTARGPPGTRSTKNQARSCRAALFRRASRLGILRAREKGFDHIHRRRDTRRT